MTQSSMPASTQRYDVSVDQMDPFGHKSQVFDYFAENE